ncbi:MAG: 1-deoxy-D-xylulose-5-phosphate synthase [Planctomycetes bacterium]|nr:1-deoxy-D-xylulose-5-phosphate synthase [Planctomycetota bacterium]
MRATRDAFGNALLELGRENPNVVALTADLGGSVKTGAFAKEFPDRFFQMGVAEANMVDVAAGMSTAGKIPFATTFAIFGTGRAWESVRNTIGYPALNVKIACTHSGMGVGEDGASHQSLEDIALMRVIPNLTVCVAADYASAYGLTKLVAAHKGPVYLRLGRPKVRDVYKDGEKFEIGKAKLLREGKDVAIIACGPQVGFALEAADELAKQGIHAAVADFHTIKPLDVSMLTRLAESCGAIVTAEDHNVLGGLGGAVAEALARTRPTPVRFVGAQDTFGESGDPDSLWRKYRMDAPAIVEAAKEAIAAKR